MFLAVWRRGTAGPSLQGGQGTRRTPSLTLGASALWVSEPAVFERRGEDVLVRANQTVRGDLGPDLTGPTVKLTPRGLAFGVGALPQYPLFYSVADDRAWVAVCTEVGPLLEFVGEAKLDPYRLASLLAGRHGSTPHRTVYANVRRVRACENIDVDEGGLRVEARPPLPDESFRRSSPDTLAAELKVRLEEAVRRAIGTHRRVCVHAGGGLDSSGVLALVVARLRGAGDRQLQVLAEVWASPGDDRPYLKSLERDLGVMAIRLESSAAAPWVIQSLSADAQPQVFASGCSDLLLWAEGVARGAEIALGGHGGDALVGGDISFTSALVHGHPLAALMRTARLEVPWRTSALDRLAWLLAPLAQAALPMRLQIRSKRKRVQRPWMTPRLMRFVEPLLGRPSKAPMTPRERLAALSAHPIWTELAVSWGQFASATGGVVVDVFHDLELARFVATIDPITLCRDNRYRGLYRSALAGLLPDDIRLRPDKAIAEPFVAGATNSAAAFDTFIELASLERLAGLGLVDPEAFQPPFLAWMRGLRRGERTEPDPADGAIWREVWPVLAVERFLRQAAQYPFTHIVHDGLPC